MRPFKPDLFHRRMWRRFLRPPDLFAQLIRQYMDTGEELMALKFRTLSLAFRTFLVPIIGGMLLFHATGNS